MMADQGNLLAGFPQKSRPFSRLAVAAAPNRGLWPIEVMQSSIGSVAADLHSLIRSVFAVDQFQLRLKRIAKRGPAPPNLVACEHIIKSSQLASHRSCRVGQSPPRASLRCSPGAATSPTRPQQQSQQPRSNAVFVDEVALIDRASRPHETGLRLFAISCIDTSPGLSRGYWPRGIGGTDV